MDNPWSGNLDKYLFYCCPECDEKSGSKETFIGHAVKTHPNAQEILGEGDSVTKTKGTISLCIENDNDFEDQVKNEPFDGDEFENVNDEVDMQDLAFVEEENGEDAEDESKPSELPPTKGKGKNVCNYCGKSYPSAWD